MATGTLDPSTPKEMVASVRSPTHRHLNPFVITERPEEKQLGISARQLSVKDFVLLKTSGPDEKAKRDKVYALKILRKADVIKLKQVEHVRNERRTLADVSGHPFITTLIASFSDSQSLYML
ncbi:hypothetical protein AOCH_006439, partial [Aspergillus ochraceoroseus]